MVPFGKRVRDAIPSDGKGRDARNYATDTRTINRRLFQAAVAHEFRQLCTTLASKDRLARKHFLCRMDAMAGLSPIPLTNCYFAYGSNLLDTECLRTAPDAQPYGRAFLPNYRLEFTKHSDTRGGDAATIVSDATSIVWGFVYRVHDQDREHLRVREKGYEELPETTVYLTAPTATDDPTSITAFTFTATNKCPIQCGPPLDYLGLIIRGALARGLPAAYIQQLVDLQTGCLKGPAPGLAEPQAVPSANSDRKSPSARGLRKTSIRVIRDVALLWALALAAAFPTGIISNLAGLDSRQILALSGGVMLFAGAVGFALSACMSHAARWRHIAIVAFVYWITGLNNLVFTKGIFTFETWLVNTSFFTFLMMILGGAASYLFKGSPKVDIGESGTGRG